MRSNWEIHGGVPCRAWQAAGIGMGEGRERHCWERLHSGNRKQHCSLLLLHCSSPAPVTGSPAPHRAFAPLTMWVCRWEHTHPVTQTRRAVPGVRPALSLPLLGQLKVGFTPSGPFTHLGTTSPWERGNYFIYWCICVLQAVPFEQTHQHFSAPPNLACAAAFGSLFFSLN